MVPVPRKGLQMVRRAFRMLALTSLVIGLGTDVSSAAEIGGAGREDLAVISTLTPTEKQQQDQQRPEYHQPVKVAAAAAPTLLPLKPRAGETVVFLGNGLAERMEHHNFFETLLYRAFPSQNLTFRNLGFPGHTPGFRPEAGNENPWAFPGAKQFHPEIKGHFGQGHYPEPDEWLTIVEASTIVAFFGFNESFVGLDGVENFTAELDAFVRHTRSRCYVRGGSIAPRLVLATPIAMEQRAGFALPDAAARNQVLAAYAAAVE